MTDQPKTELTSVDTAAVVGELQEYIGAKFDKFYQYGEDTVRARIRHYDVGRGELFAEVGETKRLHLVDNPPDAPQRPPNLPMLMRKRLSGGELTAVEQHGFDRVVVLKGKRPSGDETERYTAVIELFGDGNFVFVEGDVYEDEGKVLRPLRTVRLKSRTVAGGQPYEFPPERVNPRELSYEEFLTEMEESGTDLVRTLASVMGFGGTYAEELCERAGVKKETDVEKASDRDLRGVYDATESLFERLDAGSLEPRIVYTDEGTPVDVTPFSLARYEGGGNGTQNGEDGYETEEYETFNRALDVYFEEVEEYERQNEKHEGGGEEIAKQRRIIEQQERAIDDFETEEKELRETAETLYENYGVVDELLSAVGEALENGADWDEVRATLREAEQKGVESAEIFERVDENNDEVVVSVDGYQVSLDPRNGVESNASAVYEKAKAVAEKREGAKDALEESRGELETMLERREREDKEDEEEPDGDGSPTLKPRGENWYDRFRWFRTSDGFLVIGGRDADQNDEIYKKYLEPADLFFHTQSPGGPVTILKRTEPDEPADDPEVPNKSREEAAQFAGAYSSLWDAGQYSAEVYEVAADQVSKTPESGEYIEKGSVVVRGDRTYRTVEMNASVGMCLDESAGVIGGPPGAIKQEAEYSVVLEPGRYSREDIAKKIYRRFRDKLDEGVVRRLTGVDEIRQFLPPGGSRFVD